ncbi:MAG: gamma carbonic anhydrase family protein [Nitriliruptoraceae bacterium]
MPRILAVSGHTPSIDPDTYLADGVVIAGDVTLAAGVSVWFNSVIRSERAPVTIGPDSNLQDLCVVHTDRDVPTTLGARVTVGHRVVLHGCTIDDDVLIGMGAVVMNGAHVGAGAIVGAGAVVTEGTVVPPGTLALGLPAKVVERPVSPVPRPNVASYLELSAQYREARDV